MTKDKLLITLWISAIVTAVVDLAFIVFAIVIYSLIWTGKIFMISFFSDIALATIIINGVFLVVLAIYLIFRKK